MEVKRTVENFVKTKKLMTMVAMITFILFLVSCLNKTATQTASNTPDYCQLNLETPNSQSNVDGAFNAQMTLVPLTIDGCSKDSIWKSADWYSMNYVWLGEPVDSTDYHGRFKLAWDSQFLYILVEVIDEHLSPTLANGK